MSDHDDYPDRAVLVIPTPAGYNCVLVESSTGDYGGTMRFHIEYPAFPREPEKPRVSLWRRFVLWFKSLRPAATGESGGRE